MKRSLTAAALLLAALMAGLSPAIPQGGIANFPQTLPPSTVVGRLGITPGPTQAIPISQLAAVFGASRSVTVNARCDGSTDDTAAINADLALGGFWTLPPNRTCNVTQLNITKHGTRLSGAGFNSSIIQGTAAGVPTINVSATLSSVYLDGFQVTKSVTATAGGNGIQMNGDCQYCVIDGVYAQKSYVGIALQSTGIGYMRHVLSQYNLSDGITFTNSAISGTLQWDLEDVFSGQNGGRGYLVAPSAAGPVGVALGSWHNVRTFANTGVGIAVDCTALIPCSGFRLSKGLLGEDGNHEIYLNTFGTLNTITDTIVELAGTHTTGPTFATPASHTGDGIRITANNLDVSIGGITANGNYDSGINTSATVSTNISGYRISNHSLYGVLSANCALLTVTSVNFVSNTSANIQCTTNNGSQLVATSTPSTLNTLTPNLTGAVTSVTGVTSLGSFTSANLSGALTNETGSGLAVFNSAPALISPTISGAASAGGARIPLTANTTFNVATTGVDSNNCTSGAPCLTIQRAYDNLANFYDLQGFTATIQIANGTYTSGLLTAKCVLGQNGPAGVLILGSATPGNVLISVTSKDAISLGAVIDGAGTQGCTQMTLGGVRLQTTTSGNAINVSGGGVGITIGTPGFAVEFGATAQNHIVTNHSAWAIAGTNNSIIGGALIHVSALSNSVVALHNTTVTCSGSPAFTYFAYAENNASVYLSGMTFTSCGGVTGTRYQANGNGMIYTAAATTYLPGNAAGVEYMGGQYIGSAAPSGLQLYTSGIMTYVNSLTGFGTIGSTAHTITSASANALVVGPNGATNPSLQVDASAASAETGLQIKSNSAAGGTVQMTTTSSGANADLVFNAKGTGTIWFGTTSTGNVDVGFSGATLNVRGPAILNNASLTFTNLATDAAHTTRTVCQDTTTKAIFFGSGAAGICVGTSAREFKHDIVSMGAGLAEIVRLTPRNFFYKPGYGDDGARQQYGFIADEVVKVLPGVTGADKDGKPLSVDMLAMVPVLVNAVRELKVANDNLRADMRRLKAGRRSR